MEKIIIRGAREHNLKNINLELPRDKFIVFTGISGSGKSTLAFDTIFAEGQRRYLESLSSYARQFLGQMDKPDVDYIEGLSPAISIDQKGISHNPRSTVGTVTEIHDYLRLLYSKIGIPHCPICGRKIEKLSTDEIVSRVLDTGAGKTIEILSPVVRERKGEYLALLNELWKRGYAEAYVDGKLYRLENYKDVKLERYKKHSIDAVIDRVEIKDENLSRIFEDTERALKISQGLIKIKFEARNSKSETNTIRQLADKIKNSKPDTKYEIRNTKYKELIFNQNLSCPIHEDVCFPELEPRLFSFNSPFGACPECQGLGAKKEIDPELVSPDKNKTIAQGGFLPWSYKGNNFVGAILRAVTQYYHIAENKRIRDLSPNEMDILLHGTEDEDLVRVRLSGKAMHNYYQFHWKGLIRWLEDRYQKTDSDAVRADIEKYMSHQPCSTCHGTRYKQEVLLVTVGDKPPHQFKNDPQELNSTENKSAPPLNSLKLKNDSKNWCGGKNIFDVSELSIRESHAFFKNLNLSGREQKIAGRILKEIILRLEFLINVGLDYLTLHRTAFTLSGGESQRIRLASQIGSGLTGVLYVLDEPSVGLHAKDNRKLIETLRHLQQIGNTLIVIEHDEETIRESDWLVDIGPGAGKKGGEVVAQGAPEEVIAHSQGLTAKYLRGDLEIEIPKVKRPTKNKKKIMVRGASEHNLKNITVEFPLKVFTCVTGVSGSGKSTLVEDILYKSLANKIHRSLDVPGKHKEILGTEYVDKVVMVDQSPIGKTPRSNPATYTGLFTPIRELFAQTKDAKEKGYTASRFSFNVHGGRCDNCNGEGFLRIEMQFMPDVYLPCDVCNGARYNSETLQVKYKGKNISEVLKMTVSEGKEFFENFPQIYNPLRVLEEVGLGYIELGQSATTLSGGEAQRIKLATELSRRSTGNTLYILDEPTTGLHFDDIKKLLKVLNGLVDAGNTVVVIEHNMDIIKTTDWIIDLGPEGGDNGGRVVVTGEPEEVVKYHKESYTGKYLREFLRK